MQLGTQKVCYKSPILSDECRYVQEISYHIRLT
jgi:hypothetical protein